MNGAEIVLHAQGLAKDFNGCVARNGGGLKVRRDSAGEIAACWPRPGG